MKLQSLLSSWW